jgi:hypothetical protein
LVSICGVFRTSRSTFADGRAQLSSETCFLASGLFLSQLVNTATSLLADDVPHYVIPHSYCWQIDSVFNKLPVFMHQWEKERAVLYPVEVPPP